MRIERVFTEGLAQVAYLVGDDAGGAAAIIDPRRDAAIYRDLAANRNLNIVAVLETHIHADFVSGARELSALTGAPIYSGAGGGQTFEHTPLEDGDIVAVGGLQLRALWTPGHTPEHVSFLLFDASRGPEPQALFSGDMLFVGEVGRPDLLGQANTEHLVAELYTSIFERLMPLPDELAVWPGHGAGSSCGRSIGGAPSTTVGQEKRFNYAFQPRTLEEFRKVILEGMPPAPTYYPYLKQVNRVGPDLLGSLPPGEALSPASVAALMDAGAVVIDGRPIEAFAAEHLPGSVSIPLGANFLPWAGWLAPYEHDIVLVLDQDSQYDAVRDELRLIGIDRVAGALKGGINTWGESGRPVDSFGTLTVDELRRMLENKGDDDSIAVLDVRSDEEWADGHIEGAQHKFAGLIAQEGGDGFEDPGGKLAVICGSGYRSSVVASLLSARGRSNVYNVLGGMSAWNAEGNPVVHDE